MSEQSLVVAENVVVSLEYTLSLDDGGIVDSSVGEDPLVFLHGSGQIIPGLEAALTGMRLHEEKEVTIPPEAAYGEFDDDEFEIVPRSIFPADTELEEGTALELVDESSGDQLLAYVAEIRDDEIVLDFNHPLAGEALTFKVKIVGLRPATASEIEHGHAHENGH